jgi:hypothetical protein
MRLLQINPNGELGFAEHFGEDIPRYAILSHTWATDSDEVVFKDIVKGGGKNKMGYRKLTFCAKQAASDGLQLFWVDTCCIDKSSSTELQEAINSMYQWYQKADKCYVYLSDVSTGGSAGSDGSTQQGWKQAFRGSRWFTRRWTLQELFAPTSDVSTGESTGCDGSTQPGWKQAFQDSRWFTRGWTLQELLAPTSVEFFSSEGDCLGSKTSLLREIHAATGISPEALQGSPLHHFSIETRLSWAERRKTKREEDKAYALLGIFEVYMPLIYGEGESNAFRRLRDEIQRSPRYLVENQALTQSYQAQTDTFLGVERSLEGQ